MTDANDLCEAYVKMYSIFIRTEWIHLLVLTIEMAMDSMKQIFYAHIGRTEKLVVGVTLHNRFVNAFFGIAFCIGKRISIIEMWMKLLEGNCS